MIPYPPEKDDTDMLLAVKLGLSKGYEEFRLYGAWGGRADHEIGNIQILAYLAKHGARGTIVDETCEMTVIKNAGYTISKEIKGTFSVFSLSDKSENVTIQGAKYEIVGETLRNTFPLGVSNEMTGKKVNISVGKGMLLIIWNVKA